MVNAIGYSAASRRIGSHAQPPSIRPRGYDQSVAGEDEELSNSLRRRDTTSASAKLAGEISVAWHDAHDPPLIFRPLRLAPSVRPRRLTAE